MDVIARQHAVDDFDTVFSTNLATDIAHPPLNAALQNFIAIFCRPDEVIAMVKNAVFSSGILHVFILPKMNLSPFGRFIFGRIKT